MEAQIAKRMNEIQPSATLAITAKAKELKAAGRDIISFGAGEPDFDTPPHIKDAAKQAIDEGQTKYTPVGGSPAMKKAIIEKFHRDNELLYTEKEVIASSGAKQSLYNLFMSALNPGDEVLLPTPAWVSYPDQIKLAQAKTVPILCEEEDNYLLGPEKLKAAITPQTRMIILNSPSNPTGSAYTKEELTALGELLLEYPDILIVSDDIYEHILYDELKFYNLAMLFPKLKERCFLINGASKAYSMTGWRLGFCAGPAPVISAMEKIQGQSTSNPSSISQAATIAALSQSQECLTEMRGAFAKRRELIYRVLSSMPGLKTPLPQGAFYIFPNISQVYKTERFQSILKARSQSSPLPLSQIFCAHLLEHYDVAAVPGLPFGDDQAIRLSYALGEEALRKGLERLGNMIHDLEK